MKFFGLAIAIIFTITGFSASLYNFYLNFGSINGKDIAQYWGDTITALAFIWLVAGYAIQWKELSLQREQMAKSTQELKEQSTALVAQVEVFKEQSRTIAIQAEISKQNAVLIAQRDFMSSLSSYIYDKINQFSDYHHGCEKEQDAYGFQNAIEPFLRGDYLWEVFSNGRQNIFFNKARKLYKIASWIGERDIEHPLSSKIFHEISVEIFLEIIMHAYRYSAVIDSLQAQKYDQRPFDDISIVVWGIVKNSKVEDYNINARYGVEDATYISGVEWIKNKNFLGIEEGIRYLFEGDIRHFSEVSAIISNSENSGQENF